jgi:glycosyltransferase involved in cell wall biosynthesis
VSATRADRLANMLSGRLVHYDYFATALRGYRAYLRSHPQVDLVHVESVYPLGAVAALAGGRRPFVPTIRGGDLIADNVIAYGFARFRSVRFLLRLAFARAALVRAVSPGAREMALRYGCPPEKIAVVPRNIRDDCFIGDVPAFRAARRRQIEERHGLAGHTIVVAAGRLLPVKGFDDLVRAMPALLRQVPNATALICGPNRQDVRLGDYAAYLQQLIDGHGLGERVILVGHVPPEQMADYLAAADAVAVPSLIEGGNKILVEGAALGTPFVATETSGTVGFFTPAQGLSVPVRDPPRLAAALAELLADRETWRARSAACLAGRDRFSSATVAEAMVQVYERAIQSEKQQQQHRVLN